LVGSAGASSIVTAGATVSIVQEKEPAPPRLPASSVARASKLCPPSARPLYSCGLVQTAHSPPSSLHSTSALSSTENAKRAAVLLLSADGPLAIVVVGATVSIVQAKPAGAPRLPASSVARTEKSCAPSASGP
jgi:hypothetical protein